MISELRSRGLIQLGLGAGSALAWAVPIWATLCGAIASGEMDWALMDGVRLAMSLLLVAVGWGPLWGSLAFTDWTVPLGRWRDWREGDPVAGLPYFESGSPGDRLTRWISCLLGWCRSVLIPVAGPALGTAMLGLFLSLTLSAALGMEQVVLTLGTVSCMQLAVVLNRGRGRSSGVWDGLLQLGLPWLAGHLAFAPLSLSSAALAGLFSLTAMGAESPGRVRGQVLWAAGQLAALVVFIVVRRPLVAPFLAFSLIPQLLLMAQSADRRWWSGRSLPWLAAGMILAAWAL